MARLFLFEDDDSAPEAPALGPRGCLRRGPRCGLRRGRFGPQ
ncbi:hypothetical protein [Kitasatospora sp. NPDC056076]